MAGSTSQDSSGGESLDPVVYHYVSDALKAKLKSHFTSVESPLENTHKVEYNGITLLLSEPQKPGTHVGIVREILNIPIYHSRVMAATDGFATIEFGHPWPSKSELPSADLDNVSDTDSRDDNLDGSVPGASRDVEENPTEKYIHVTLKVWDSDLKLTEDREKKMNDGLMAMLGKIINHHGLTYKKSGLFLRVRGVEKEDKPLSCIKLTDNKSDIWRFLGMCTDRSVDSFRTWDDLMKYAATCHFHDPTRWILEEDEPEPQTNDSGNDAQNQFNAGDSANGKRISIVDANNFNMFNYWTKVYLPTHANKPRGKHALMTRKQIIQLAREQFGEDFTKKVTKDERARLLKRVECTILFRKIREFMPTFLTKPERKVVIKGLRRVLGLDELDTKYQGLCLDIPHVPAWKAMREAFEQRRYKEVQTLMKVHWVYAGASQKWFFEPALCAKNYNEYKARKPEEAKEKAEARKLKAEARKAGAKLAKALAKTEALAEEAKAVAKSD